MSELKYASLTRDFIVFELNKELNKKMKWTEWEYVCDEKKIGWE